MLDTWLRGATEEIAGLVLNEIRRDLRDEVVKLTKGCLSRWDESQIEFKAKLDERWEERHIGMRAIVHEELDHVIGKQETHEARVWTKTNWKFKNSKFKRLNLHRKA